MDMIMVTMQYYKPSRIYLGSTLCCVSTLEYIHPEPFFETSSSPMCLGGTLSHSRDHENNDNPLPAHACLKTT